MIPPVLVGALTLFIEPKPTPHLRSRIVGEDPLPVSANMQALLVKALYWSSGGQAIATQSPVITSQRIQRACGLASCRVRPSIARRSNQCWVMEGRWTTTLVVDRRVRSDPKLVNLIDSMDVEAERKGESDAVGILAAEPPPKNWPSISPTIRLRRLSITTLPREIARSERRYSSSKPESNRLSKS